MNDWASLQRRFETLVLLAAHGLFVTTDELCQILGMAPAQLVDLQQRQIRRFAWRNFILEQAGPDTAEGAGWRVLNQGQASATHGSPGETLAGPPALAVQYHGFWSATQREQLGHHVLAHEGEFTKAKTRGETTQQAEGGSDYRRCLVLTEMGPFADSLRQNIGPLVPGAAQLLGLPPFAVTIMERHFLAYTDGCYSKAHADAGPDFSRTRRLSFVYFFRLPGSQFSGGELLMQDANFETLSRIQPQDNTIIFFDSRKNHEVLPVQVPSQSFRDSRFALVGWLHGGPETGT